MTKATKAEIEESRAKLLKHLKPGDTVYTLLEHRSASGMSRDIRVLIIKEAWESGTPVIFQPNHHIATLLGLPRARKGDGVRMSGCGMDMGFEIVYRLGRALWPQGTDKPHGRRNGEPDSDGGYALKHQWL